MTMQDEIDPTADPAIACTLGDADLRDRQSAWLKLRSYITATDEAPGGLTFSFAPVPGLLPSLRKLVALEAECCAWMTFAIANSPGIVRLSISAKGEDGERGVRESFAPLRRG
ncbi:MAG: hypothetical protein PVSMB9_08990 [Candidatus Dormibacteria bacterium]